MALYNNILPLHEALNIFYADHNLGKDGGINKAWAKIKVGKFYIPFPNTKARKKVLVFHDIHHIVTGYDSTWKGEVSIGTWEIATGCGKNYMAWILNLYAMAVGLFLYPKAVFNAFIRGKRTRNLYHDSLSPKEASEMQIKDIEERLLLNKSNNEPANFKEIFSFIMWSILTCSFYVISFSLPIIILIYLFLR